MFQSIPVETTGVTVPPPPPAVRALLLDDSSFDRARIKRLSRKANLPVQLDEVGSIEEMDRAVQLVQYDLILIDYRLPVGDGMEALQHVLSNPRTCDAGKIMITGDGAVDTAVRAMRGGYHDFLPKEGMNAKLLSQAMLNAMTLAQQRRQLQSEYQREVIRQGLVAALADKEVRGNVVSIVKEKLAMTAPDTLNRFDGLHSGDVDALITSFGDDDEFVFH